MSGLSTTNFQDSLGQNSANSRDVVPLNFIVITVFVSVFFFFIPSLIYFTFFGINHALPEPRSLRYRLIQFFTALGQCSPLLLLVAERRV